MEFKIGEGLFLGGDSVYHLSSPIQGLESPAYRVGDGVYAGRDGGYVSGHYYGHRTIVLKGFYVGKTCEEAFQFRKVLFGYLKIRYRLPILITTPEGKYYTEGYITDIKSSITNMVAGEYQITLLCPESPIYEATEAGALAWIEKDLMLGDSTIVANDGDIQVYPIITLTGSMKNIELVNETTEQIMEIDVEAESPADEIVVDMEKRIVTLNGEAINEYRTLNSSWWYLANEANNIRVAIEEGTPEVKIKYKKGFVGI